MTRLPVRPAAAALACAAVTLFAALSFSAAAGAAPLGAWQLPGTPLSGTSASESQMITTSDGSTVIAWLEGGNVITRTRPAGGDFGPTVTVDGTGPGVKGLRLASAPDGTVWIGWVETSPAPVEVRILSDTQTVDAVSRPPGGSFGAVQTVDTGLNDGEKLRFAFTPDSSNVYLAWVDSPVSGFGRLARVAVKVGAASFGTVEEPLPNVPYINDLYVNVIQSGIAAGTAVITALNYDPSLGGQRVVAAIKGPTDNSFGAVDPVSDTDYESSYMSEPQIGPSGDLTVAFQYQTVPSRIQSATLSPGETQFSDPLNASDLTSLTGATRPTAAIGPSGKIAISYLKFPLSANTSNFNPAVAIKEAGGSSYVQKVPAGSLPAGSGGCCETENEGFSGATVAIGPDNRATLAWTSSYDFFGQGTVRTELASSEDSNGDFAAPVEVSARGTYANSMSLHFTPDGELTAEWPSVDDTGATMINVATRSTLPDPAAAFSEPLKLTTNGELSGFTTAQNGMQTVIWHGDLGDVRYASTASPQSQITVTKEGTGSGTVTSSPAGIDCGATCTAAFNQGLRLTLTATPAAGSSFTGWTTGCLPNRGASASMLCRPAARGFTKCSNSSLPCTFSAYGDHTLVATFTANTPPPPPPPPPNVFSVEADGASTANLMTVISVPGAGKATQTGSFYGAGTARSARAVTACRGSKKISKAGRYRVSCKLTSAARSARRRHAIRVTLRTTFTPTGGSARTVTRTVTLRKTSSGVTG